MRAKDIVIAILAGILTSILVFTSLNFLAVIFPLEGVIFVHAIVFTILGILIGYLLSTRKHLS
jgi:hypothetical protein